MKIVLIAVVSAVLAGAVALIGLPRVLPGVVPDVLPGGGSKATPATTIDGTPVPEPEHSVTFSLGERIVNLADPGGYRYLKIEVVADISVPGEQPEHEDASTLTAEQDKLSGELAPLQPKIQDALTTVLSAHTVDELTTPDGKAALKQELLDHLQPIFTERAITGIYFAQFVIQ